MKRRVGIYSDAGQGTSPHCGNVKMKKIGSQINKEHGNNGPQAGNNT